ncbi:hypothetical protein Bra5_CH01825 [Rhizobium phaseoli Brasil 5]|nr:hypothetical protein Bra5_CH01825 [Rhizobium phaseoli Brasil 5]
MARQGRADPSLGVKNKKPLVRLRCTRCAKYPDQRLCWWRPPLDAEFLVFCERLLRPHTALIAIDLCDNSLANCVPV